MNNNLIEFTATIFYIFSGDSDLYVVDVGQSVPSSTVSHDQITRLLSRNNFDSRMLWKNVKSTVRQIEQEDAVLITDDTIQEKPYVLTNIDV